MSEDVRRIEKVLCHLIDAIKHLERGDRGAFKVKMRKAKKALLGEPLTGGMLWEDELMP